MDFPTLSKITHCIGIWYSNSSSKEAAIPIGSGKTVTLSLLAYPCKASLHQLNFLIPSLGIASDWSHINTAFSSRVNLEIKSSEDRAKAVSAPLHRSIEQVLDRLDTIESRGLGSYSEVISAPNSQNMISPQPIENGFVDLNKTDFDDLKKDEPVQTQNIKKSTKELSDDEIKKLKECFDSLDTENTGSIGVKELEDPLIGLGFAESREEV